MTVLGLKAKSAAHLSRSSTNTKHWLAMLNCPAIELPMRTFSSMLNITYGCLVTHSEKLMCAGSIRMHKDCRTSKIKTINRTELNQRRFRLRP